MRVLRAVAQRQAKALVRNSDPSKNSPSAVLFQRATATDLGLTDPSILFNTLQVIATSVFC